MSSQAITRSKRPRPRARRPRPLSRRPGGGAAEARYLAGLYDLNELGLQWRRQAAQVGMEAAELWIGLTDGGAGLEDFLRTNFARAPVLILDFYHPAERLCDLTKLWHPQPGEVGGEAPVCPQPPASHGLPALPGARPPRPR